MTIDERPVVVVGVDGSRGSRAALRYALDEAARRHARLRVVAAAQPPDYWAVGYGMAVFPPMIEILTGVRDGAQRLVDEVLAERSGGDVPVEVESRQGPPAEVLCGAAEGAELLVLGHRGRGALRSAMLGSVGLSCVLHAPCPVTVVRGPQPVPDAAPVGATVGASA